MERKKLIPLLGTRQARLLEAAHRVTFNRHAHALRSHAHYLEAARHASGPGARAAALAAAAVWRTLAQVR